MKISFVPKIDLSNKISASRSFSLLIVIASVLFIALAPAVTAHQAGGDKNILQDLYEEGDICNPLGILSGFTSSYGCSAAALKMIGANLENAWIYGAISNILLFLLPLAFFSRIHLSLYMLSVICALIRGFNLYVLSKELIVSYVVIVSLLMILKLKTTKGWFLSGLFYGSLFRLYWLLAMSIWFAFSRIKKVSFGRLLIYILTGYVVLSVLMSSLLGRSLTYYRESVTGTYGNRGTTINTLIHPVINSENPILLALDAFISLLRLCVPVEALYLSPGVNSLVVSVVTPICVGLIIRGIIDPCKSDNQILVRNIAIIPLAMLCVQAIFEPDYGSFVRHFYMLSPFIFTMIGLRQIRHAS